jgi:Autographiviridae endonuclease VII
MHYKRFMKYGDPLNLGPQYGEPDHDGKRTCTDCGELKPLEAFGKQPRGRNGRNRICKRCMHARSVAWQRANPERVQRTRRAAYVRRVYGDAGVRAEQRRLAGDGCDVCGQRLPGKRGMAIDHCHVTGVTRGLLCRDCNTAIGQVGDDPTRLRALADYLERA